MWLLLWTLLAAVDVSNSSVGARRRRGKHAGGGKAILPSEVVYLGQLQEIITHVSFQGSKQFESVTKLLFCSLILGCEERLLLVLVDHSRTSYVS
jgi:hypothetical protein